MLEESLGYVKGECSFAKTQGAEDILGRLELMWKSWNNW